MIISRLDSDRWLTLANQIAGSDVVFKYPPAAATVSYKGQRGGASQHARGSRPTEAKRREADEAGEV